MKRWLLTLLLLAFLVLFGASAKWWLPPVLTFLGTQGTLIQTLSDLLQLIIWLASAAVVFIVWFTGKKKPVAETAPAAPQPILPRQIPSFSRDFTDRTAEITKLKDALFDSGLPIYVLQGISGVGKTELAKKFATEFLLQNYPNAHFFYKFEDDDVAEFQRHVISAYRPDARLPDRPAALAGMFRSVLHEQRVLLLLDNVSSSKQVQDLIPPKGCALIVTSRSAIELPGMSFIKLKELSPDDATALLLKIAPRIGSRAKELAELCGCLPFVLQVVGGAVLKRDDLDVDEYVRRLRDANERLQIVQASLDLSFQLLDEQQRKYLCSLSVFAGAFDAKAAAAVLETAEPSAKQALGALYEFSLVEWRGNENKYFMPDLIRLFATSRCAAQDRAASEQRHARYYIKQLRETAEGSASPTNSANQAALTIDAMWFNIQAAQAWLMDHLTDGAVAQLTLESSSVAVSRILSLRRPAQERIDWYTALVNSAQASGWKQLEARNLVFLSIAYRDVGNYKQTREICEKVLAFDAVQLESFAVSGAWAYSGIAHYYEGNYQVAVERCQTALTVTRASSHLDQRLETEQLRYIGHALKGLGDFDQALSNYEESLKAARQTKDTDGETNALAALGRTFCDSGEHQRAIDEHLPKAVAAAKEIGDQRSLAFNLGHLGLAQRSVGRYQEALETYKAARQIAEAIEHRTVEAYCAGGLAKTHLMLGELDLALEEAKSAVDLATEVGMERAQQHWQTLAAQIHLQRGQPVEALAEAGAALLYESKWNQYRTLTLSGLILANSQQPEGAAQRLQEAITAANQLLQTTPKYFDARYVLAIATLGLASVGSDTESLIARATELFKLAVESCRSKGIIEEALRLADEVPLPKWQIVAFKKKFALSS